jgi:uncharacterized membrane protein YgdD (TMEM256/DUF423 family)
MNNKWTFIGGIFALLAVALGAFGAHGLESRLTPHLLDIYKTGAYYQMIHALGLLVLGHRAENRANHRLLNWSGALFTAGILLFSGSLYALALSGVLRWGMVTPLGGLCFLAGWAVFIASVASEK